MGRDRAAAISGAGGVGGKGGVPFFHADLDCFGLETEVPPLMSPLGRRIEYKR